MVALYKQTRKTRRQRQQERKKGKKGNKEKHRKRSTERNKERSRESNKDQKQEKQKDRKGRKEGTTGKKERKFFFILSPFSFIFSLSLVHFQSLFKQFFCLSQYFTIILLFACWSYASFIHKLLVKPSLFQINIAVYFCYCLDWILWFLLLVALNKSWVATQFWG